jgi:hypothetical protein
MRSTYLQCQQHVRCLAQGFQTYRNESAKQNGCGNNAEQLCAPIHFTTVALPTYLEKHVD